MWHFQKFSIFFFWISMFFLKNLKNFENIEKKIGKNKNSMFFEIRFFFYVFSIFFFKFDVFWYFSKNNFPKSVHPSPPTKKKTRKSKIVKSTLHFKLMQKKSYINIFQFSIIHFFFVMLHYIISLLYFN